MVASPRVLPEIIPTTSPGSTRALIKDKLTLVIIFLNNFLVKLYLKIHLFGAKNEYRAISKRYFICLLSLCINLLFFLYPIIILLS